MFEKIVKYMISFLEDYHLTPVLQYSSTPETNTAHFIVAKLNTNWNFRGGLAVQQ